MAEPDYSFTIPSLFDSNALDCRLYHPRELLSSEATINTTVQHVSRLAILAHPYAPLGGSYDDPVVLALTHTLLDEGYVVGTFNFRGAGSSSGHTSWTGRAEADDFSSFIGLAVFYIRNLNAALHEQPSPTHEPTSFPSPTPSPTNPSPPLRLLLSGYSFGSLILARLPPVPTILTRFDEASRGTPAAEIFLRARTLARQTHRDISATPAPASPGLPSNRRSRATTVTVGGDVGNSPPARRSKDLALASAGLIRDVIIPQRVRSHLRHRSSSGGGGNTSTTNSNNQPPSPSFMKRHQHSRSTSQPILHTSPPPPLSPSTPPPQTTYLLISPVLVPLTTLLAPTGLPSPLSLLRTTASQLPFLHTLASSETSLPPFLHPDYRTSSTLILFGDADPFTSAKRLGQWCESLSTQARKRVPGQGGEEVTWKVFEGAGHFWRERKGLMKEVSAAVLEWVREDGEGGGR